MRTLTLHEKISLKGVFSFRLHGIPLPRLDAAQTLFLWPRVCGYSPINSYHKYRTHKRGF